jgi:hypothetical protein
LAASVGTPTMRSCHKELSVYMYCIFQEFQTNCDSHKFKGIGTYTQPHQVSSP